FARRCVEAMAARPELRTRPLVEATAETLGRIAGVTTPAAAFRPADLPLHLLLNYRVGDRAGATIATGRDLPLLKQSLAARLAATLGAVESPFNRDGLIRWDFGDLPERVELLTGGVHVEAFPSLVDQGSAAGLRLHVSAGLAARAHRSGVLRLCML